MNSPAAVRRLVEAEIVQCREEGLNVTGFEPDLKDAGDDVDRLAAVYEALQSARAESSFSYVEPSDLNEILRKRPDGPRRIDRPVSEDELSNRILGAWLGRCAGCQLGKPCEGWPAEKIRDYLSRANAYPLSDYFPEKSSHPDGSEWRSGSQTSTREQIRYAERDDDQDYTMYGLWMVEANGLNFTPRQIADGWISKLPYYRVYTAERCAYRNFVNEIWPPDSATFWNPYREWIGAQIRADFWGYAGPGWMERAAEMAWRDASVSHTKNGIYGEMFFAALIASAFVTSDLNQAISYALAEIPSDCRFTEMVHDCLLWSKEVPDWDSALTRVQNKYGHYHPVHTINNAALVLIALLYGRHDYERTICYAVMGGWDTDCNGATAGSVLGAMHGADELPSKWISRLNDTVTSIVEGFTNSKISDLARRTCVIASHCLNNSR